MASWILGAVVSGLVVVWAVWGARPFGRSLNVRGLLEPGYSAMETGYGRRPDGTMVVSALTRMPGVKAAMVRWWFCDYMQSTEHYVMWHPADHVWMDWADKRPGQIVGASHLVRERIGGELDKLRIAFFDPAEMFGMDPNSEAMFVLCAKPGPLDAWLRVGQMCHVVRDTPWGAEMRSRFWLGHVESVDENALKRLATNIVGNTNLARRLLVKKSKAAGLLQHCLEEMGNLSDFLPALYRKHKGGPV